MTAEADSTLGHAADVALVLPQAREACPHNLAPTTSSLMQLALGDAIAIALLESRGFTALDFGCFIRAGGSARCSSSRRDVMHTGDAMPLARAGTPMSQAIVEMSAKGFGCVGIADEKGACSASSPTATCGGTCAPICLKSRVEDVMTRKSKDGAARSARQRTARNAEHHQDHLGVRRRSRRAGRRRTSSRPAAEPARA